MDLVPSSTRIVRLRPRSFTIADLMILVAGSAIGVFWTQAAHLGQNLLPTSSSPWREHWRGWLQAPVPVLASAAVATLICRMIPPRPPLRRLARQPGSTALVLITLIVLRVGAILGIGAVLAPFFDPKTLGAASTVYPLRLSTLSYQIFNAGKMAAALWIWQAAAGRWRPERSWIDRTGRGLGIALILLDLLALAGLSLRL